MGKQKKQIISLILPITWHIIYLLSNGSFDKEHRVYCDLVFYFGIAVYFIAIGSISLKSLWSEWKKGKQFWLSVLFCMIGVVISFGVGIAISTLFPNTNDGINAFKIVDIPSLLAFALTTIFLPPVAEEAFYRKGIVNFDNKIMMIVTAIIGIILYTSEHSLRPLGLLISSIWAVPFTLSYIRTKNVYVTMTAHFICNVIMNGITVIFLIMKFLS